MGLETAAIISLAGLGTSLLGTGANLIAQDKQNREISKANRLAIDAANEQKKEIKEQKAAALAERKSLIDEERLQLGAGLGLGNIVGTRAISSGGQLAANILG